MFIIDIEAGGRTSKIGVFGIETKEESKENREKFLELDNYIYLLSNILYNEKWKSVIIYKNGGVSYVRITNWNAYWKIRICEF